MNRSAFQKLAHARLLDARALLKARRFDAAYYLAGYAVECALKACIAKKTRRFDFPPNNTREHYYKHDFETLLKAAGLKLLFETERRGDATLDKNWELAKDWKPDSRYDQRGRPAARFAKELLKAIEEKQHGVLQCLYKYW